MKSIKARKDDIIICIDDDQTIHQIWQSRFSHYKIHHFTSPKKFEEWWANEGRGVSNKIVLIDYEFLNHQSNGFDVITDLGINCDPNTKSVMLVSSHYEEKGIQAKAEEFAVPIVPKGMAPIIPIEFVLDDLQVEAVLIDDDPLVRMTWELAAKESGSSILTFKSFDAFCEKAKEISKETPISVDMNLSNGVKGTDVAVKLHNMGFKRIYLATGYEAEAIDDIPTCVLAVRGKDPVFSPNSDNNSHLSHLEVQV